ncbi:hypothetical protein WDV93_26025 [Pantoea ananatis]
MKSDAPDQRIKILLPAGRWQHAALPKMASGTRPFCRCQKRSVRCSRAPIRLASSRS